MGTCPAAAAKKSGVRARAFWAFGSAPRFSRAFTPA
jgi:hypothetical protein